MAQTAMITPSKTSIWKRRRNKKKSSSSDYSSSSKAATGGSPTNVCRIAELRTNNGVAEAAVVTITVDNNDIGKDEAAYVDSPAAISKSNYTMQDNHHDDNPNIAYFPPQSAQQSSQGNSNYSAASYFNSILSGHRLSFSEEDESHANNDNDDGVIIHEVRQHSSFAGADDLRKVDITNDHDDVGEKWRPFGTDLNEDDVEKLGLSSSPNEVVNADNSPQQESSPNNNSNNFNNDAIITTPLTDPPTTQRKTLTPEFFLGSGSNNKNNLNIQKKKGTKRLDTSTTINDTTTAATSMKENHHHHNNNLSSSNISTTSSSDGGHMYAEIYLPTKAKKKPYPPPPSSTTMMGGVSRDRSTLSSHTIPSLAMTMVSSLSGRSSLFGAQENGCMPVVISPDQHNNNNDEMMMGGDVLGVTEYNYFDYDANAGAPLSPQGVSPQRELQNMFIPNIDRSRNSSHKANNDNNNHHWKSRVNSLWKSVSKHTCRCFGEPFSNEDERDKWKVSSATTAATSTTAANTSAAAAAAAVRKMNQTPMFSTPVKDNGIFD